MNWEEFNAKKLSDTGTRYLHYSELISVWEEGAEMISTHSYIGKAEQDKLDLLKAAVELLRNTLDGMAEYHDSQVQLRKLVDWVPTDPTNIPGGRGTALERWGSVRKFEDIT